MHEGEVITNRTLSICLGANEPEYIILHLVQICCDIIGPDKSKFIQYLHLYFNEMSNCAAVF